MDELGRDLVDQVAISLHHLLCSLREGYTLQAESTTRVSIQLFFKAIDQAPRQWQFLVAERWGGSAVIREAVAREIHFFIDDLAKDLKKLPAFESVKQGQDVQLMASLLINLAFSWVMSWLNLPVASDPAPTAEQYEQFIQTTTRQVQLMFRGISNWP